MGMDCSDDIDGSLCREEFDIGICLSLDSSSVDFEVGKCSPGGIGLPVEWPLLLPSLLSGLFFSGKRVDSCLSCGVGGDGLSDIE